MGPLTSLELYCSVWIKLPLWTIYTHYFRAPLIISVKLLTLSFSLKLNLVQNYTFSIKNFRDFHHWCLHQILNLYYCFSTPGRWYQRREWSSGDLCQWGMGDRVWWQLWWPRGAGNDILILLIFHDDIVTRKCFPNHWLFVRGRR